MKKAGIIFLVLGLLAGLLSCSNSSSDSLKRAFKNPPESSHPGVYWYFMDGN